MSEMPIAAANLDVNDPQAEDRQRMLAAFATNPESNAIWETVYDWVRAEGDVPQAGAVASDIPVAELIDMADKVRATAQTARYGLMTETASNGKLWFDVLEGFSDDSVRQVLQDAVETSATYNRVPFYRTLDLGTGIGKSLSVLQGSSEVVVGVDRNPALLTIARQRAGTNTTLVQAEVTALPFADNCFDLISSLGIQGALDKPSRVAFYREIARVLMPGAAYLSAFYNYPNLPSEYMDQLTQTSKAMLADMIGDTVAGGLSVTERLDEDETDSLLTSLGLHKQYYLGTGADDKNQAIIQVVTKT